MSSAAVAAQRLGGGRRSVAGDARQPRGLLSRMAHRASRIRPLKALAVGVFSLSLVGIVANAVMFQKGPHPAPLFGFSLGQSAPAVRPDTASKAADATAAVPASAARTATTPVSQAGDPAQAAPQAAAMTKPTPARHAASKPRQEDGIGRLLQTAPSAEMPAVPEKKPNAAVMAAQKQLAKLGYSVKPDGLMSAATRHAVTRFEHDRHLKADTAMTPALRRQIAAAAAPDVARKSR